MTHNKTFLLVIVLFVALFIFFVLVKIDHVYYRESPFTTYIPFRNRHTHPLSRADKECLQPTINVPDVSKLSICSFSRPDPFADDIKDYVKKYPPIDCKSGIPSIVKLVSNDVLLIDQEKALARGLNIASLRCKYRTQTMKSGQDFETIVSEWSSWFHKQIKLKPKDEHLIVECFDSHKKNSSLAAKSYLSVIKDFPRHRRHSQPNVGTSDFDTDTAKNGIHANKDAKEMDRLSVLMLGIDGLSRAQMIRSMPKTRQFLFDYPGTFELTQHSKVGLNTFPNVIAILTGKSLGDIEKEGWNTKMSMDSIRFIWSDFEDAGYMSQLILDKKMVTSFHTSKLGWRKSPVTFYNRPTVCTSDIDQVMRQNGGNCIGDTPEIKVLTDYQLDLVRFANNISVSKKIDDEKHNLNNFNHNKNRDRKTRPFFSYNFFTRLTHDDQNQASSADHLFLEFLQKLSNTEENMLNNTILFFFSDHGPRFGQIRWVFVSALT